MTSELRRLETPDNLEKFVEPDPYVEWQTREGVKVITDFAFEDLDQVELGPWERKGGSGAVINIPQRFLPNDAHLVEIKPGGKSEPEHHLYEETMYVVSGIGATSVWLDDEHKITFEWHEGSLVSIPLNAWYQHFNASGTNPARYLSVTNAPPVMRQWRNDAFIFDNPFQFTDRFTGDGAYFSGSGKLYERRKWASNFIPNAQTMMLWDYLSRGAGGVNASLEMAGNVTKSHISEFPVGTYKKAHRHTTGPHLLIMGGVGFSLLWNEGHEDEMIHADWKKGGMVIIPNDGIFHQHFNTGTEPARYLALRAGNGSPPPWGGSDVSVKDGGAQIEYEDEHREVHELFEAELAKHGVTCQMKAFVPYCTGDIGPTSERDT
ncbi:MAG: cupin domain-containing protein [Chloroflexi bacterium]|nr:cupin domain-containing protein [Chloroflexota bacterium]